jgi:hypothetical protein
VFALVALLDLGIIVNEEVEPTYIALGPVRGPLLLGLLLFGAAVVRAGRLPRSGAWLLSAGRAHLRLDLAQPAHEQGLRAFVLDGRGVHPRGDKSPDDKAFGAWPTSFGRSPHVILQPCC